MSGFDREIVRLDLLMRDISRKVLPRSAASALNKTASLSRTRIIRGVSKQLSIQQKIIRKRIYVRRATPRRQVASVAAYVRGLSAIRLKPRDTGRGGWSMRKGKGVKARGGHHFPNAFIAKGRNAQNHVFERTGKVSKRDGKNYHHVDVVRIAIDKTLEDVAPRTVRRLMNSRFDGLLQHEINHRLTRLGVK